jgi:hypothetical protein
MRILLRLAWTALLAGCTGTYRATLLPGPVPDSRDGHALVATSLIVFFFIGIMLVWRGVERD